MWRSIGAVVFGFLLIGALSFGGDAVVKSLMPGAFGPRGETSDPLLLCMVQAMVGVFAITGCYVAARLAPNRPMAHALVLGVLGLLFNIAGTVRMWDVLPAWYHALALLLVMPYAWIGGRLAERHGAKGEPGARRQAA